MPTPCWKEPDKVKAKKAEALPGGLFALAIVKPKLPPDEPLPCSLCGRLTRNLMYARFPDDEVICCYECYAQKILTEEEGRGKGERKEQP